MEVPGPNGPERSTFTTVAKATCLSSSRQRATLSTTGFIRVPPFGRQLVSISACQPSSARLMPGHAWRNRSGQVRFSTNGLSSGREQRTTSSLLTSYILSVPLGGVGDGGGELL